MKVIQEMNKCIVCGKESEQLVVLSSHSFGPKGLDCKMVNMYSGTGIQQCPYCNYCNYDISKALVERFEGENALQNWQDDESIKCIIDSSENKETKKYLLMAEQYRENDDHKGEYSSTLKAYWASDNKDYLVRATSVYTTKLLPEEVTKLMQYGDLLRQNGDFEKSKNIIDAVNSLIKAEDKVTKQDYEFILKFIDHENKLIRKKDKSAHTTFDVEFDD